LAKVARNTHAPYREPIAKVAKLAKAFEIQLESGLEKNQD
jgi:hypothetical protein